MSKIVLKTFLLLLVSCSAVAQGIDLGSWYCIGPFKDEEFGNIDRTLEYEFEAESDYFNAIVSSQKVDVPLLSKVYEMKPFPGYLDLDRQWVKRSDWSDGYYNLLPRGPAPSRNEAVYFCRTIQSKKAQTVQMWVRMQDFYKIWLNGEFIHRFNHLTARTRYSYPVKISLKLKKGNNYLLIKNVSRWAEHGFSFGIEGLHDIKDPYYYDVFAHDVETLAGAEKFVRSFKFSAKPIPMHSPAFYDIETSLGQFQASEGARKYDQQLQKLEKETIQVLSKGDSADIKRQAQKLDVFLQKQVEQFAPILFLRKPLHAQNAIAPYDNMGALPAEICLLDPSNPDAVPRVIYSAPEMRILDMSLSYDGQTIFFSGKDTESRYGWNIYEIGIDGTGLRQITNGDFADIAPFELPSGRIAFVSTRKGTFVECQGRAAGLLYTMARDGSDIRLISANIDSDHSPRVTNDGRILFTRWDYGVEKNVFARHGLWTVNPDGTNLQLVAGNTIEDPGGFWEAWPIPGRPEFLTVFGPHHNHHAGMIGLVWNGKGPEAPRGVGYRWVTREFPIYGDMTYQDGYQNPFPINEKQFLVSYGGIKYRSEWKKKDPQDRRPYHTFTPLKLLYLDAYGNERVIYQASGNLSCYSPILLQSREIPPVIPGKVPPVTWKKMDAEDMNRCDIGSDQTATMMVQDVYKGISKYVKPGEAKYIAVMEQIQKSRQMVGGEAWGHTPLIGRGTVHARRLIGLVPVEEDGSAFFKVPVIRSVSLNVLDEAGKTLMRMGSDIHLMPGENVSCIGCHEVRESGYGSAPPMSKMPVAVKKAPVEPQKQGWGTQGLIDYVSVVQPVFDKYCTDCHSGATPKGNVNLTGDKTRFFNQSYDQLVDRDIVDHLSVFSLDHDEGTPKTVGAYVSRIDDFFDPFHCGSEVSWEDRFRVYCWIDANVPYYGTYHYKTYPEFKNNKDGVRGIGARDSWESNHQSSGSSPKWAQGDLQEMFDRRCADCHERNVLNQSWLQPMRMKVYSDSWGDKSLTSHGFGSNKWKLVNKLGPEYRINLTNPSHSLFLQAPLSEDEGGAGLCTDQDGSPIFKNKKDPDYQKSLKAIETGAERLKKFPRIDMYGTDAFTENPCEQTCLDSEDTFFFTSHRPDTISQVDTDGNILWQYTDIHHPQDFDITGEGNIFCSEIPGAKMITREGEVLWSYKVPENCQNPVAQEIDDNRFLVGNEGPGQLLEINAASTIMKKIQLQPRNNNKHGQFRFCRKTDQDTYLVPLTKDGLVHEYAEDGTILIEFGSIEDPVSAVRLENGNTLIGSLRQLGEYDSQGNLVWSFDPVVDGNLPEGHRGHVTGLVPLEDGKIAFAFYHGNKEWPDIMVVNREKEVVKQIILPDINKVASIRVEN